MNASTYRKQRDEALAKLQTAVELASDLIRQVRISASELEGHPLNLLQALHKTERFLVGVTRVTGAPRSFNTSATNYQPVISERTMSVDPGGHFEGHNG